LYEKSSPQKAIVHPSPIEERQLKAYRKPTENPSSAHYLF